ncbi:MAG TPA: metallophosphoesterase [Anaerolineales bacterium]|nr:metallophosphoesterase [Anaerolineales bacterium]
MLVLRHNTPIVKILAVSDEVVERLYTLCSSGHFREVDLILGCGDLPYPYLENLLTFLNKPLFYVPGNHDPIYNSENTLARVEGGSNVDRRVVRFKTFLIGGLGGSIQYRPDGTNQYSQTEAYLRAFRLLPGLLLNRINYGRSLDILITHSPPFGIHDEESQSHQGLKAINWLIRMARPRYHFHGHTHFHRQNLSASETTHGLTKIMNVFPYKVIDVSH